MSTFQIEIVTPTEVKYAGPARMLTVQGVMGQMGILAQHAPLLSMLDPGLLSYTEKDGTVSRMAAGAGFVQVAQNKAICLVDFAERPDEIDATAARARADELAKQIPSADTLEREKLREELKKAQARLAVAAGR
ncbi:MAG: ATP synthase F1 subunit epsilon [Candidatus Eremiobacterota bacterium]